MTRQTFFKYREKTNEMLTDYLLKNDANSIYLKKTDYHTIDIDNVLDISSTNPIANAIVTEEINKKIDTTDFNQALDALVIELNK